MMFTDPIRYEKPNKTQELVNYYTLWVEFALGEVWGGVRYLGYLGPILGGKAISWTFYIDDIFTANSQRKL